jgi:hypothetical protein
MQSAPAKQGFARPGDEFSMEVRTAGEACDWIVE